MRLFVERRLNTGGSALGDQMDNGAAKESPAMRTTRNEVAVEIAGLNKWFGEFHVLRDVNLTVMRGERIVICGPSGSGKSTLLRCINRIENWQQGRVIVDGLELTDDLKTIDEVRREVGMVFQQFNLFPHLTVLENCTLAPIWVRGCRARRPRRWRGIISRACASRSRPTNIRASFPAASSSASRSRARSACSRRSCCSTSRPRRSIPKWSRRCSTPWSGSPMDGMTMLVVSHEMGFARQVASRMVLMDAGPDHRGQRAGGVLRAPAARAHQAVPEPDSALSGGAAEKNRAAGCNRRQACSVSGAIATEEGMP